MKFDVKYSKFGNLFFFISNLAEWSPYCRKEYNKIWLKNNPLNKKEAKSLYKLRKILKKYKISVLILSSKNESEAIKKISKIIPQEDISDLKNSLRTFNERFNILWRKEVKNLISIKEKIKKTLIISKKLFSIIKILYGIKKEPRVGEIFLFTNPILKRPINGGSGFGKDKIGIECSKITKTNNIKQMLQRAIIHEIVHASFENNLKEKTKKFIEDRYFKKKYKKILLKSKIYKQTNSILGPIKEMILVSLIPEGYLAEKFFNLDVINNLRRKKCIKEKKLKKNYYDLMLYAIYRLYSFAKDYSENKKPIDNNYIEEAIKCWIEFEKTDLKKI
jgi:hypothetical protein